VQATGSIGVQQTVALQFTPTAQVMPVLTIVPTGHVYAVLLTAGHCTSVAG
jgi:hypothetical protein